MSSPEHVPEHASAVAADQVTADSDMHGEMPVVQHYKFVDLQSALAPAAFLPLEKHGGMYVAKLATPLLVQTPPLALLSPLEDDDGHPLPYAHLAVPRAFLRFLQDAEERVFQACVENKGQWFRRAVEDQTLRASFKQFCKPSEDGGGVLKIKVPRDVLVFDSQGTLLRSADVGTGATMRALLELSRVCFGRTEFGALWTLTQAQTAPSPPPPPPPPRCLIDPGADEAAVEEPAADADLEVAEFL